ncbi:hypothetical protein NPIL_643801 [Nephila pilipes]|uniref:Uncharacterized protein n=1 Tax=Nephila pilipes TaxID=299642 RepID=A0A8X6IE16_NEPPI|nr:hypothetical protein NPIL_643801 [Nephila pilipes]
MIEISPGRENVVRLVKIKKSTGIFLHPIQRLFPLEIFENDPLQGGGLLYKQVLRRHFANPAADPDRPIKNAASTSSIVTRSARVIYAPHRLGLRLSSSIVLDLNGVRVFRSATSHATPS